jgi:beta-glucanase (GH16 family)
MVRALSFFPTRIDEPGAFMWPNKRILGQSLISAFLLATVQTAVQAQPLIFSDNFDSTSCLRRSGLSSWLDNSGDLVLTMANGGGQGLKTTTEFGHGRYEARIKTDVGGGAVVAFYLMGVDNSKRNDPAYFYLHDEIDFELVATLNREGNYLGRNATWFNAFHNHTAVVLPKNPQDDAGGSMMSLGERDPNANSRIFDLHVVPDIDRSVNFYGHNFNDGQYYTYTIDWRPDAIIYSVANDNGAIIKSYTLDKTSDKWPKTKMYVALSIWSAGDYDTQWGFSGKFDYNFGRPMRAFVDFIKYEPLANTDVPSTIQTNGEIPWESCGYVTPATLAPQPAIDCKEYNTDGRSCADVGFVEGQVGSPWGTGNGRFRCVNQCLQWLGR